MCQDPIPPSAPLPPQQCDVWAVDASVFAGLAPEAALLAARRLELQLEVDRKVPQAWREYGAGGPIAMEEGLQAAAAAGRPHEPAAEVLAHLERRRASIMSLVAQSRAARQLASDHQASGFLGRAEGALAKIKSSADGAAAADAAIAAAWRQLPPPPSANFAPLVVTRPPTQEHVVLTAEGGGPLPHLRLPQLGRHEAHPPLTGAPEVLGLSPMGVVGGYNASAPRHNWRSASRAEGEEVIAMDHDQARAETGSETLSLFRRPVTDPRSPTHHTAEVTVAKDSRPEAAVCRPARFRILCARRLVAGGEQPRRAEEVGRHRV